MPRRAAPPHGVVGGAAAPWLQIPPTTPKVTPFMGLGLSTHLTPLSRGGHGLVPSRPAVGRMSRFFDRNRRRWLELLWSLLLLWLRVKAWAKKLSSKIVAHIRHVDKPYRFFDARGRGLRPRQRNCRRNMLWRAGANAQGANLNVPQEEMVLDGPKRPKNGKMEPVPALLNSLYRAFGKRTVFGNLRWGGPTGQPHTRRNAIKTGRSPAQGANLNVPQEEMVLNDPKRPKNGKMEPVPARLNSLYGAFGKRTVFGNLRGGAHGAALHKKKCY